MRLRWLNLLDNDLPFEFAVVPLTGHLVRRSLAQADQLALGGNRLHRLMGWQPVLRMLDEERVELDAIVDPEPVACHDNEHAAAARLGRVVILLLKWLPLLWVIKLADLLPPPQRLKKNGDMLLAVGKMAQLFGRRTQGLCLLKAIERRTYLRWLGIESQMRIGIFIPTEEMHAWIEINHQPLLESPDFLAHYRVALTID